MRLLIGIAFLMIVFFFYMDQHGAVTLVIRSFGIFGIIIGILLMGAVCMTPIPSEGLLVIFLKVYGVLYGLLFAWIGSTLGAMAIFLLARSLFQPMIIGVIRDTWRYQIEEWVRKRGTMGLLIARLLPIPAVIINYAAGLFPGIRFYPYLWTAIVSMAPYYAGTALLFLGIAHGMTVWLIVGSLVIAVLVGVSYMFNRKWSVK